MNMENSERFFRNEECKHFPCHKGCDKERFNCLFCYCPLYFLGENCGGDFKYAGKSKKVKSCEDCTLPHDPDYYAVILKKLKEANNTHV